MECSASNQWDTRNRWATKLLRQQFHISKNFEPIIIILWTAVICDICDDWYICHLTCLYNSIKDCDAWQVWHASRRCSLLEHLISPSFKGSYLCIARAFCRFMISDYDIWLLFMYNISAISSAKEMFSSWQGSCDFVLSQKWTGLDFIGSVIIIPQLHCFIHECPVESVDQSKEYSWSSLYITSSTSSSQVHQSCYLFWLQSYSWNFVVLKNKSLWCFCSTWHCIINIFFHQMLYIFAG